MRADPARITVIPARRYGDATGFCWPVDVPPSPSELLSSWLHRVGHANGVPPRYFGRLLGATGENWSARLDRRLPGDILRLLAAHTRAPLADIVSLSLGEDLLTPLRLPLRPGPGRAGASHAATFWLQYCPACLSDDQAPYFRRGWTLATRVSCFRHGRRLRDRCPSCGDPLAPFKQAHLAPQQFCASCGAHLGKPTAPANSGVQRLERLVDDLLHLHAAGRIFRDGRPLPDLLGATCFLSGSQRVSIARLSHRTRYRLFNDLAEGAAPFIAERSCAATACWARIAASSPTHRGLTASFTDAALARSASKPRLSVARLALTDLLQAAARAHQKRGML